MGAKIDHDQIAVTHKVARGSGETSNLVCPTDALILQKFWIQDTLWRKYSQGRFQAERHQNTLACKAHCLADEGIDIGRLLDLLCGRRAAAVAGAAFDP